MLFLLNLYFGNRFLRVIFDIMEPKPIESPLLQHRQNLTHIIASLFMLEKDHPPDLSRLLQLLLSPRPSHRIISSKTRLNLRRHVKTVLAQLAQLCEHTRQHQSVFQALRGARGLER